MHKFLPGPTQVLEQLVKPLPIGTEVLVSSGSKAKNGIAKR